MTKKGRQRFGWKRCTARENLGYAYEKRAPEWLIRPWTLPNMAGGKNCHNYNTQIHYWCDKSKT